MAHPLDNVIWQAFSGPLRDFTVGSDTARRFAPGISPILGFAQPDNPDFASLRPYCAAGEEFYTGDWAGPCPAGWTIEEESTMHRMAWDESRQLPARTDDAVPLRAEHASQALELAILTHPGPFGLRTIELGDYLGYFEGGRLIAMAGERLRSGNYHEISGVCTHPDFQGRGLARRLMAILLERHRRRGAISFLHVMRDNTQAHEFYQRLGFRQHHEPVVRVIRRR